MAGLGRFFIFGVALVVALVALAWPQIEQQLVASGYSCPYPFSMLLTGKGAEKEAAAEAEGLPKYTLDQLRMCVNRASVVLVAFIVLTVVVVLLLLQVRRLGRGEAHPAGGRRQGTRRRRLQDARRSGRYH